MGFAFWAAIDCSHIAFGYVASYSFAMVLMLGCASAFVGLVLMIYWRTRSTGAALLGTGIATYLVFLGCIGVLKKFDKVAWVREPPCASHGPCSAGFIGHLLSPSHDAARDQQLR